MACSYCNNGERDTGIVHAHLKTPLEAGTFAFKCPCESGTLRKKNYPIWSEHSYRRLYIPEYEDSKPMARWIIEMTEGGRQKSDEFRIRMERWGRENFVRVWKEYQEHKKAKEPAAASNVNSGEELKD